MNIENKKNKIKTSIIQGVFYEQFNNFNFYSWYCSTSLWNFCSSKIICTKLKCKIKILKSKIKYFIVEYCAYIKTKYWTKKFIKKQIRVAKRIKNYQCANDLKSVIKRINKMNKDEFRIYSDRLASGLSGMISA